MEWNNTLVLNSLGVLQLSRGTVGVIESSDVFITRPVLPTAKRPYKSLILRVKMIHKRETSENICNLFILPYKLQIEADLLSYS